MRIKLFLFVVVQLFVFHINAQNLESSLGGIETGFQFYSDTTNLKVTEQIIIRRAENRSSSDASFGTGWGLGYQSFHLEFITRENLAVKKFKYKTGRDNNDKLTLTFYDSGNVVLASYTLDYAMVDVLYNASSGKSQYFYSIDLTDIPVVLLNKTVKINLIKETADRNKY